MQWLIDSVLNYFRALLGRPRRYRVRAKTGRLFARMGMAVVLMALAPAALAAEDCAGKVSMERVRDIAGFRGDKIVEIVGVRKDNGQANYNATPPVGNLVFDHIWLVTPSGQSAFVVVLEIKGCVHDLQVFTPEQVEKFFAPPNSKGA